MKHPVSQQLHGYWDRLRGARAAPERGDIDPAAIRAVLADTFLAEVVGEHSLAGRDFIIRLSGTRLNALRGGDLRDHSLLSLWRTEDQAALRELLGLVLDDRRPVVAGSRGEAASRRLIEFEALFLPLRHHGKTHTRLFGSIAPHEGGDGPGARPLGALTLTTFRSIASTLTFAMRPVAAPPGARQHGRFKVYEGGR